MRSKCTFSNETEPTKLCCSSPQKRKASEAFLTWERWFHLLDPKPTLHSSPYQGSTQQISCQAQDVPTCHKVLITFSFKAVLHLIPTNKLDQPSLPTDKQFRLEYVIEKDFNSPAAKQNIEIIPPEHESFPFHPPASNKESHYFIIQQKIYQCILTNEHFRYCNHNSQKCG